MAIQLATRTGFVDFSLRERGVLYLHVCVPVTPAQQEDVLAIVAGALTAGRRPLLIVGVADEAAQASERKNGRAAVGGFFGAATADGDG